MIGIRELRSDLAAHVRRAAGGQRMVITVDGRPTAQLAPLEAEQGQTVLADLIAAGAVMAPRRTDAPRPSQPIPIWSGGRLDRMLREIRG